MAHVSVQQVARTVSCLVLENNCSARTSCESRIYVKGVFSGSTVKPRTNSGKSAFLGKGLSKTCSRKGFQFESRGLCLARVISAKDSEVEIGRRKPWQQSISGPSRFEDFPDLEPDTAPRHEEQVVPGRDVAPVVETPGERYLRLAMQVQDAKNRKNYSENENSSRDQRKAFKKNEETRVMGSMTNKAEELGKKKKKKGGVPAVNTLNHNQPSCYGCGAILQTQESEAPGYIPPQTYELKKKHHQLKTVLCGRCRLLSQGHMIPAVGGLGGYGSGKGFVLAEELRSQLSHLRHKKALIVKLVDMVDFNGSFLTRVRDLVGANPIIMVLTKCDLLPEGTDLPAVSDWLQEVTLRKKLSVVSIHMTSAKAKAGISRVAADIARQRLGRDVYVLGSANVGKSAFVTALLEEMAKRDPVAAAAFRRKPIQSAMPGTTLGAIEFEAFSGGGKLFDTPGVHLHHRMAAVVDPKDVALLAPRRRLRGYVIGPRGPEEEALEMEPEEDSHLFEEGFLDNFLKEKLGNKLVEGSLPVDVDELDDGIWTEGNLSGTSLFWGGVLRIDIVKLHVLQQRVRFASDYREFGFTIAPEDLKLTFFGPSAIRIRRCPTEEADDYYEENLGSILTPPTVSNVENWDGLGKVQDIIFELEEGTSHPVGDIAISGLGWITVGRSIPPEDEDTEEKGDDDEMRSRFDIADVEAEAESEDADDDVEEFSDNAIELVLHTPKAVEVFVRPSIPLGKSATSWYKYGELNDAELAARPVVYY